MKSKFKKLMAAALVLCLMLALLPAGVLAEGPYAITVDSTLANGTVTVEGNATNANENDTVTFTATPDVGCGLMSVKVYKTGEESTTVSPSPIGDGKYTFTMPAYDVTITATFSAYHNVTCATSDVTVNSPSVMEGDWVIVTPAAKEGYDLDDVWYQYEGSEQTKLEATNGVYQFIMGTSNVTVGATFTEIVTPPEPVKYSITTAQSSYGTIGADKQQAAKGETVNVTVTTITDYVVSKVYY